MKKAVTTSTKKKMTMMVTWMTGSRNILMSKKTIGSKEKLKQNSRRRKQVSQRVSAANELSYGSPPSVRQQVLYKIHSS